MREPHFEHFLNGPQLFPATEVIFENYLYTNGERREILSEVAQKYFLHLHGVSSNIGSFDDLNKAHFLKLKDLAEVTGAKLLSDHLCFTKQGGKVTFELLPVPLTENMLAHVGQRLDQIRQWLGQDFLLENISSYFTYTIDEMTEAEFMARLADEYHAKFLLDVNNLYVNSVNQGLDGDSFLSTLPMSSVRAYHVAGHEDLGSFLFDTHGSAVVDPVVQLFRKAVKRFGGHPTFLERDENIPASIMPMQDELNLIMAALDE